MSSVKNLIRTYAKLYVTNDQWMFKPKLTGYKFNKPYPLFRHVRPAIDYPQVSPYVYYKAYERRINYEMYGMAILTEDICSKDFYKYMEIRSN